MVTDTFPFPPANENVPSQHWIQSQGEYRWEKAGYTEDTQDGWTRTSRIHTCDKGKRSGLNASVRICCAKFLLFLDAEQKLLWIFISDKQRKFTKIF